MNELLFYANETVREYILKAERIYGRRFLLPRIEFGIRGETAGRAFYKSWRIELNTQLFQENQNVFITRTIPHEVAHLISYALYGNEGMGHKTRWKSVMRALGVQDATRCHKYATTSARIVKRKYHYVCNCHVPHILTSIKHNRIRRGVKYRCRHCIAILQPKI